uniref:Uncharacterized protein n=2 Tax=Caenorhabditis japonica TaxID=281687 RepID=A0A8R1IIL7_CAEJA
MAKILVFLAIFYISLIHAAPISSNVTKIPPASPLDDFQNHQGEVESLKSERREYLGRRFLLDGFAPLDITIRRKRNILKKAKHRLEKVGEGLEKGAKNVGKGLKEGVENVGEGFEKGAKSIGQGVKKGAKNVGEGFEKRAIVVGYWSYPTFLTFP